MQLWKHPIGVCFSSMICKNPLLYHDHLSQALKFAKITHANFDDAYEAYYVNSIEIVRTVTNDSDILSAFVLKDTTHILSEDFMSIFYNKNIGDLVYNFNFVYLHDLDYAMDQDWRINLFHIVERLYYLQYLHFIGKYDKVVARESVNFHLSLANYFHFSLIRNDLGDISHEILYPRLYKKTKIDMQTYIMDSISVQKEISYLRTLLQQINVQASITFRTKSVHSTLKKIQARKLKHVSEVNDINAIRIVTKSNDPSACYIVLQRIHRNWFFLYEKNYIAFPKKNGYKSLHTTIVLDSKLIEIQIRTEDMDHEANFGKAAHWKYKKARSDFAH